MIHNPLVEQAIARHRQQVEDTLVRLRIDDTLDDREKGRRITQVIAAANFRLVELVRQRPAQVERGQVVDREPISLPRRRVAV